MGQHKIALQLLDRTPRGLRARQELIAALDNAKATEPDEGGCFEVAFDCSGQDHALDCVWNAVAATGADDHLIILEHPAVAHHWEHRADRAEPATG